MIDLLMEAASPTFRCLRGSKAFISGRASKAEQDSRYEVPEDDPVVHTAVLSLLNLSNIKLS